MSLHQYFETASDLSFKAMLQGCMCGHIMRFVVCNVINFTEFEKVANMALINASRKTQIVQNYNEDVGA